MSIATSATVKPSRLLAILVAVTGTTVFAVGAAIMVGVIGELSQSARTFLGTPFAFLAVFGVYHGICHRKTIHIDISGAGQIRLRFEASSRWSCMNKNWPHVAQDERVYRLQRGSTIWTHLLLLRLEDEEQGRITIPILPDCVSRDNFRTLSVACRWLAIHGGSEAPKVC